jgi:hypothetical protein
VILVGGDFVSAGAKDVDLLELSSMLLVVLCI